MLHSVRGTMHLHRVADVGLLAAALRPVAADELVVSQQGRYFLQLGERGMTPGQACDDVAAAMRDGMADGRPRTKGELSGAVTSRVDVRLRQWCQGCGVEHVHDGLFRYATLQAGLAVVVSGDSSRFRFRRLGSSVGAVHPGGRTVVDSGDARRVLVRRFLRACGAAGPRQLAAARGWWRLVAVELAGASRFMHRDDRELVGTVPEPPRLRLLAPYDPLTEIVDRELAVSDPVIRKRVWRANANPGVLLRRGGSERCGGGWW